MHLILLCGLLLYAFYLNHKNQIILYLPIDLNPAKTFAFHKILKKIIIFVLGLFLVRF